MNMPGMCSHGFRGDSRIRIAHLQLLPLITGVQTVTLEELKRLDRAQFDPYIICKQPGPLSLAAEREGIPCLFVSELERSVSLRQDWRALWKLTTLFRDYAFDIVHTHSSKTGVLGRIAARLAGVPTVVHTVHGYAFPAARNLLEKTFFVLAEWVGARCCSAMIVLKEQDRKIGRRYLHVPNRKLHLLTNGIDTDVYRPPGDEKRREVRCTQLAVDDQIIAVGMVGRLSQQKNPICFIEAANSVLKTRTDIRFFVIGDGELRQMVEEKVRTHGLDDYVRVLGWREDIPDLLAALDIFVLPSYWEGLSLALIEALSTGVAVITSDIPGNRDVVTHETNGLLFRNADSDDLARNVLRLASDPELRTKLAGQGRCDVLANHRLEQRVARMIDLYHRLTTGGDVSIQQ